MKKTLMLLFSCLFMLELVNAQMDCTICVNPDYARGGTVSQRFNSVIGLPLETTKVSLSGLQTGQ